ncbi:MAG TPA: hypothetical protein DDX47_06360 [Candidatus Jacksonbacteria bacterium]|nr:hypothetical protein [Candidatus Jacksonbacteria bacterium]HCC49861.1 hypothetical protein [Candidatus Jacksonbacteria bacterium]HCE48578.1 hypothetical protein [Candidatus Jacksonbacteria bacterium]HCR14634.1 hypothetical protein [Candidatus Jacksonbacteria bacterium]
MNNQQFGPATMVQGNWNCSKCNAEITELPFEPDGTRPVYCRDCHRSMRKDSPQGGRRRF